MAFPVVSGWFSQWLLAVVVTEVVGCHHYGRWRVLRLPSMVVGQS